jgi:histidinol phosphatase-like enzyme
MFSEDDVDAVNRRMDELMLKANGSAVIDRHEFCPFHPEAAVELYRQDSELRKPKPGMILAAAESLALDLGRSWVIGDAPRDVEAGKAAGCRAILLKPAGVAESPAAAAGLTAEPDAIVSSLKDAIDFIERSAHNNGGNAPGGDEPTAAPATPRRATKAPAQEQPPASRLEQLAEQILLELRRRNEHASQPAEFSVSKLLAGVVQVAALAALILSYVNYKDDSFLGLLLAAIYLQTLTIALLVMGRSG